MNISSAVSDRALTSLSFRYAAALDQRDLSALLRVFHPLATLHARPPGRGPVTMTGHDELAKLIDAVSFWQRTFHLVGQELFTVDDGQVRGEVYCVAHHLNPDPSGQLGDDVMLIRYRDRYVRDQFGDWVVMERVVTVDALMHVAPYEA